MWTILGLVGVGIAGFLAYRWWVWRRSRLLRGTVVTNDGLNYSVKYERLHDEAKPVEHVRLILMFGAKILYNLGETPENEEQRREFLEVLSQLARLPIRNARGEDVLTCCERPIAVDEVSELPNGKRIAGTLGFVGDSRRSVSTSLPATWYSYQFVDSWLALICTSLPNLDGMLRKHLEGSLRRLNEMYSQERVDPATVGALKNAPNQAFLEARLYSPSE